MQSLAKYCVKANCSNTHIRKRVFEQLALPQYLAKDCICDYGRLNGNPFLFFNALISLFACLISIPKEKPFALFNAFLSSAEALTNLPFKNSISPRESSQYESPLSSIVSLKSFCASKKSFFASSSLFIILKAVPSPQSVYAKLTLSPIFL